MPALVFVKFGIFTEVIDVGRSPWICISTIQHMYSILRGQVLVAEWEGAAEENAKKIAEDSDTRYDESYPAMKDEQARAYPCREG